MRQYFSAANVAFLDLEHHIQVDIGDSIPNAWVQKMGHLPTVDFFSMEWRYADTGKFWLIPGLRSDFHPPCTRRHGPKAMETSCSHIPLGLMDVHTAFLAADP